MKKLILCSFILILIIGTVQAQYSEIFATIGQRGLSFTDPGISDVVNGILCLQDPLLCGINLIKTYITGEIYQEISEVSPEAATALLLGNQIQALVGDGAEIVSDLEIDEEGRILEGTIAFGNETDSYIGNLVGEDFREDEISVRGVEFIKEGNQTIFIFTSENSNVNINGTLFENILQQSDTNPNPFIQLDNTGGVIAANFTVNEDGGVYNLGGIQFEAPPNSIVFYDKDSGAPPVVTCESNSEIDFLSEEIGNGTIIYEGGLFTINGNGISSTHYGDLAKGRITLSSDGRIIEVWENTNAVVDGIEHNVNRGNLNLYYEDDFDSYSRLHEDENYINYGEDFIALGGSGFTSRLREGNEIFPGFEETYFIEGGEGERQGILEFTPRGGKILIEGLDEERTFFNVKITGNTEINNGEVRFISERGHLYTFGGRESEITYPMNLDIYNGETYFFEDSILRDFDGDTLVNYATFPELVRGRIQHRDQDLRESEPLFTYIDEEREEGLIRSILEVSEMSQQNTGVLVSPEVVLTSFMMAGGRNVPSLYLNEGEGPISGLDLGEDYAKRHPESGGLGNFNNLREALITTTGNLISTRRAFLYDHVAVFGEETTERLSDRDISLWSYFYQNVGEETGSSYLRECRLSALETLRAWILGGGVRPNISCDFSRLQSVIPFRSVDNAAYQKAEERYSRQKSLESVFNILPP